jgi:uncharacterized protein (TIGR00725 family)
VGPGDPDAGLEGLAEEVGRGLAERGAVLVCGGLGGVMAAACRGARDAGGTAVGLLPGRDRAAGNEHLSVALATGIGELRNGLIVGCSDVVVAIGGSWGTMSEVALALRTGKPVVALTGWHVDAPPDPLLHEVPEAAAALRVLDALLAP